jgi:AraC-like DNA-binding protein
MFASHPHFPSGDYDRSAMAQGGPARLRSRAIDAVVLQTLIGQDYQVLSPAQRSPSPLMQGYFSNVALRDGISMHCTDILQLQDMATQLEMREEGIKVLIKLEGNADVFMDEHTLPFVANKNPSAAPQGAVVALNAPATFRRYAKTGAHQRMVVLTVTPAWLEAAHMRPLFNLKHLAMHSWKPTPRAVAIAEQLLHPGELGGMLHRLLQESRALELLAEAFGQILLPPTPPATALSSGSLQRARRLQQFLDSGDADQLDMSSIAQAMGCNATTLQQQFREMCGQTIFEYMRLQRLQRAAHALVHRGVSVAHAADIAGYSSQANFSTAYRKHFGITPKHSRNRL